MESTSTRNLHRSHAGDGLPKGALWGAFALVALTLVLVFADQATDAVRGHQTVTQPQSVHSLSFTIDGEDGPVTVSRADSGEELAVLAADNSRFLRTVVSSLLDTRERSDIPTDQPFDLIRWSDGTMVLADPINGQYMPLNGFGPDNERAFHRLFAAAGDGS
jgi:putative photosynthetic complex assembly protein